MKTIVTTALLMATLAAAMPASAGTHTFTSGKLKGQSFTTNNWAQSKCDTYVNNTKAQNRRMVAHCIGKVSKDEYMSMYHKFIGDYYTATDKRVIETRRLGLLALAHPDIKWKSRQRQKNLEDGKIAASVIGSVTGAWLGVLGLTAATSVAAVSGSFFGLIALAG